MGARKKRKLLAAACVSIEDRSQKPEVRIKERSAESVKY